MTGVCSVALTGGLASGKSSVARQLAGLGADVCDADAIVHELYRPGQPGARAARELFGPEVLDASGAVDREHLGRLVQEVPEALRSLQEAVHPLVHQRVASWLDTLRSTRKGSAVAVVEAALLIENGSYQSYDVLVVVWCRRSQQLARAVARGVPAARAEHLLSAQLDLEAKRDLADVVIDNSGGPEQLPERAAGAWRAIQALCATAGDGGGQRR